MTWHRAENTDNVGRLKAIAKAVNSVADPVLLPLHPRTRKALESAQVSLCANVKVVKPLSYCKMTALMTGAKCVLTDSGGVQKEAYWCKVPCITMRDETEWTETVDSGWNCLVGADAAAIGAALNSVDEPDEHPILYGDGFATKRIIDIILDTYPKNI